VVQDVRGKYGSEGDFVMNRPLHGPLNPTPVDDATDSYDTIEWLVRNTPESNGKVGILGISYNGFEPLMALVNPHPALKVAVPMSPMVTINARLYDRIPQTFVTNILVAKPTDYRRAVQRIYRAGANASFVELPLIGGH
jgi:putative CocE/NonD family hydrolase